MEHNYTIGQLAKLAGISIKTLRVYERKGLLVPQRNIDNDYRFYDEEAVKILEKIQLMKYLDFSLDQIADFLKLYANVSRETMLLEQKRLIKKKIERLNSVISNVDRAVDECKLGEQGSEAFLKALKVIIKNQRADELVIRLQQHSDEPRGWARFIFDTAMLGTKMHILDAGAGYGNLWRSNKERIPVGLTIQCVDRHNTHMDTFQEELRKASEEGGELSELVDKDIEFVWDDLETMTFNNKYDRIFFNHVAFQVADRVAMYRKFADALAQDGAFICTWGGLLFYEKLQPLMKGFLSDEEYAIFHAQYNEHVAKFEGYENELKEVFSSVVRHEYKITLNFDIVDQYVDYIQQVCKPLREFLELRRLDFIKYLSTYQNEQGKYSCDRDTYLYMCKKE